MHTSINDILFGVIDHISIRNGLPDMKIECIYQDSNGLIWIGTHDGGLGIWDGYTLKCFDRKNGIESDSVYSILEDSEKNIWLGTNKGVIKYKNNKFQMIKSSQNYCCLWGSCIDSKGHIWFGLDRIANMPAAALRWDGDKMHLTELSNVTKKTGQSIHDISLYNNQTIWFGGDDILCYYNNNEIVSAANGNNFNYVYQIYNTDGIIKILTSNGWWYLKDDIWNKDLKESDNINIKTDNMGIKWTTNTKGILCAFCDNIKYEIHRFPIANLKLLIDNNNDIWISTYGMGLYKYSYTKYAKYNKSIHLKDEKIYCVSCHVKYGLLVSTKNGIFQINNSAVNPFDFQTIDDKMFARIVDKILIDNKGCIWISSQNGNIGRIENNTIKWKLSNSDGYSISSLRLGNKNSIWFSYKFGGKAGCFLNDKINIQSSIALPLYIGSIIQCKDSKIWVGSSDLSSSVENSLYCYTDKNGLQSIRLQSDLTVNVFYEDVDCSLWIGTNKGIYHLTGKHIEHITSKNGLTCNIILDLYKDKQGIIWIGTEGGGVCSYYKGTVQKLDITKYLKLSIVYQITEYNNKIWLATSEGLVSYIKKQKKYQIKVKKIIDKKGNRINYSKNITIDKSSLKLTIFLSTSSNNLSQSSILYRFKIKHIMDNWKYSKLGNFDIFDLDCGNYIITAQVLDQDFNFSNLIEFNVQITEDPHFEALNQALLASEIKSGFIGRSIEFTYVNDLINKIASTDLSVLILGESGTGKGMAAREIHALSDRRKGPFITVNCGAIQESLIESELFGHDKGAFTGADRVKIGKFELANKGTIFLDEIGELKPEIQAKLLHVIQDKYIERLGDNKPIFIDFRVISATNKQLHNKKENLNFRQDLFFRLSGFTITMPPLKNRKDDIIMLVNYFRQKYAQNSKTCLVKFNNEVLNFLLEYDWPGNIRELEHMIQRAIIISKNENEISMKHINIVTDTYFQKYKSENSEILSYNENEKSYLLKILSMCKGKIAGKNGAAMLTKLHPNTLRSKIKKLNIKVDDYKHS